MDETATQLLKIVADAGSNRTMQPIDWQHLYAYTLYVHRQDQTVHARTVRDALITQGCSQQKAAWLSTQYHHFAELLALYDHQKNTKMFRRDMPSEAGKRTNKS